MDYYKKRKLQTLALTLLFIFGSLLQFIGHRGEGYKYLLVQVISLSILLLVLYLYNKRQS